MNAHAGNKAADVTRARLLSRASTDPLVRSPAPRREFGALAQRFEQAAFIGNSFACDIKRRPMIHRRADHFQPDRHVHARLEPEHLDRTMSLIVIHRDHEVEVTTARTEKERVGRQGTGDIESTFLQDLDRRDDLFFLLAITEQAVFARVRIDAAHANARLRNSRFHQRRVTAFDRALYEAGLDLPDRVDDADMRRHMNHAQMWRNQHHRDFLDAGQMREHFSVARILVAACVQRFLVERRGADRIDLLRLRQLDGARDVLLRGIAGHRRELPEGEVVRDQVQVDAINGARFILRLRCILDAADFRAAVHDLVGLFEAACVADHKRTALLVDHFVREALDDDLGTDAGCIAHRDADYGESIAHDDSLNSVYVFAARRGKCWFRAHWR